MTAAALATGGGIVFGGDADRRFFALDADTGALLWERRLNGDISGAPVTFEVGGRQYVAVGAGGRIGQTTSYARLTNTTISPGSGVMWGVRPTRIGAERVRAAGACATTADALSISALGDDDCRASTATRRRNFKVHSVACLQARYLGRKDWTFSGRREGSRRTPTASINPNGLQKLEAGAVYARQDVRLTC